MGILLKSNFDSRHRNITYTVEIHDTEFTGTETLFDIRGKGFILKYQGEDYRFNPLMTSKVSFAVIVENDAITTALETIINGYDGRFFLVIKKSSSIYWVGPMFYDEFRRENKPYPYDFNLSFTDGLATLKSKDYIPPNGFSRQILKDLIFSCLSELNTLDYYSTTDTYFASYINWIEFNHVLANDTDALILTNVDHRAFKIGSDTVKYLSYYEVLRNICIIFGARLIQSNGTWRFIQINHLAKTTAKEIRYYKDGSYKGNSFNKTMHVEVNDNSVILLGKSSDRYKPGLKKVDLTYSHKSDNNFAAALNWNNTEETQFILGDFDFNDTDTILVELKILFAVKFQSWQRHFLRWRLTIKVGSFWLKRKVKTGSSGNITVEEAEWVEEQAYYEIVFYDDSIDLADYRNSIKLSFETPPVPTLVGQVIVKVEGVGAVYYNEILIGPNQVELTSWSTGKTIIELINGGDIELRENSKFYEIENIDYPNNVEAVSFNTIIGDGTTKTSLGKLQIWTGSVWQDSQFWSIDVVNENLTIQELLIQEILRGRKKTITYFEASFRALFDGYQIVQYDGKKFMLSQGAFDSNLDRWKGTWFEIGPATGALFPIGGVIIKSPTPVTNGLLTLENSPDPVSPEEQKNENIIIDILDAIKKGVLQTTVIKEQPTLELDLGGFTTLSPGQTGRIINYNTGASETFTVASVDSLTGNITMTSLLNNTYPEGSFILGEDSINKPSEIKTELFTNQTGGSIEVSFDLPTDTNEVYKRLDVFTEYGTPIYNIHYTISNNTGMEPRVITFNTPLDSETVLVRLSNN